MKKVLIIISCVIALLFVITHPISGLDSKSIVRLKKAGVGDPIIQTLIREKAIETAAFTVQEIIDMKKAGLSEKTIQMVVEQGSFMKDTAPVIYGKDIRTIEFTTARDIIELKEAGISDDVIQAIIHIVGESSDSQKQEAYDLLKDMHIRIDLRDGAGD